MLRIHTARIGVTAEDCLDITRKTADAARAAGKVSPGEAFAPPANVLSDVLTARKTAASLRVQGEFSRAEEIEEQAWSVYVPRYRAAMQSSWKQRRDEWQRLLCQKHVTLVCFCTRADRCHRSLLANFLLLASSNTAQYLGELVQQNRQVGLFDKPRG